MFASFPPSILLLREMRVLLWLWRTQGNVWGFRDSLAVPPSELILCSGLPDEHLNCTPLFRLSSVWKYFPRNLRAPLGQDSAGASAGIMKKFPLLSAPGVPGTAFIPCPEKPPALLGEDVQISHQNGYSSPNANLLFPLQQLLCSSARVSQKGACAFIKAAPKL